MFGNSGVQIPCFLDGRVRTNLEIADDETASLVTLGNGSDHMDGSSAICPENNILFMGILCIPPPPASQPESYLSSATAKPFF